jgi:DUF4097 and DUF4098 domain-containing protein YvlB
MEKLEVIKAAHLIDHYLQTLSVTMTEEVLRRKTATLRTEWQELAYAITAHVCGVETNALLSAAKKKASRKRPDELVEQENQGANDETRLATDTSRSLAHPRTAGQS